MKLIFPPGQNYDCGSCSKCCRGAWAVPVEPKAYEKIHGTPLFHRMKEEIGSDPVYQDEVFESGEQHGRTALRCGACVFLAEDKLCMVHKELGIESKPLGCRQFPFLLRDTPDGVYVGLSFFCSAVQANSGRPLEAHTEEIQGFLGEHQYPAVGHQPVHLTDGYTVSWEAYRAFEDQVGRWLHGQNLDEALWDMWSGSALVPVILQRSDPPGEAPVQSDGPSLSDLSMQKVLRRLQLASVAHDEVFQSLDKVFVQGIIGALDSTDPEVCRKNTEAIFKRGSLNSENLKSEIDLQHFDDFRTRFDVAWCEPHVRRFLDHLLFRKFLGFRRNVLANVAAIYMVVPLLAWFRDLSAYWQNKLQPDATDLHRAFDICERSFTLHSECMDPFLYEMVRVYTSQMEHVPVVMAELKLGGNGGN